MGDETCQVECPREVVNEIQDMFISWSHRFMQSLCMSEYFRLSMILQMFICLIRKKRLEVLISLQIFYSVSETQVPGL